MRFHEIRTKSALNRVPGASRLPFDWTVNPYRGCSHACTYCMAGDTPILLADGRTRAARGPARRRPHLRDRTRRPLPPLVTTEVLAHWSTVKPAYRVTLDDGTELVASGDHRFLSRRAGSTSRATSAAARAGRISPLNDRLVGIGRFAAPPDEDADYRRGYLCGIVRGDGHVGIVQSTRAAVGPSTSSTSSASRSIDLEALDVAHGSTSLSSAS